MSLSQAIQVLTSIESCFAVLITCFKESTSACCSTERWAMLVKGISRSMNSSFLICLVQCSTTFWLNEKFSESSYF